MWRTLSGSRGEPDKARPTIVNSALPLDLGERGFRRGLPFIGPHRRYPRHLFALGYGGNGMTFGFLAARLLLSRPSATCRTPIRAVRV
jgi:hypothetical protein